MEKSYKRKTPSLWKCDDIAKELKWACRVIVDCFPRKSQLLLPVTSHLIGAVTERDTASFETYIRIMSDIIGPELVVSQLLLSVVATGTPELVETFLKMNLSSLRDRCYEESPVSFAAVRNWHEIVRLLVRYGMPVDFKVDSKMSRTPLSVAITENANASVEALLALGADTELISQSYNGQWHLPVPQYRSLSAPVVDDTEKAAALIRQMVHAAHRTRSLLKQCITYIRSADKRVFTDNMLFEKLPRELLCHFFVRRCF